MDGLEKLGKQNSKSKLFPLKTHPTKLHRKILFWSFIDSLLQVNNENKIGITRRKRQKQTKVREQKAMYVFSQHTKNPIDLWLLDSVVVLLDANHAKLTTY